MSNRILDIWYSYEFIRRFIKPFEKWEAYKLGIIDDKGTVLKKRKELKTTQEKKAFGLYDVLVLNLKKLLATIPGGSTRLGTAAAGAALFLKEKQGLTYENVNDIDTLKEDLTFFMHNLNEELGEKNMKTYKELMEDLTESEGIAESSHLANELVMFADNDESLYRRMYIPIIKNLMLKLAKEQYVRSKAQKAWLNFYNEAARSYKTMTDTNVAFPVNVRKEAAKIKESDEYEEIKSGAYDDLIREIRGFKKYEDNWEKIKEKM